MSIITIKGVKIDTSNLSIGEVIALNDKARGKTYENKSKRDSVSSKSITVVPGMAVHSDD